MILKTISTLTFLSLLFYQNVFSIDADPSQIEIIPRASWWANVLYNDVNSDYWSSILESRAHYIAADISPESIAISKEKTEKINNYLNNNFSQQFNYQEKIDYNPKTNTEYAWDLKYTEFVDSIIVHHTHSEYEDDLTGMQGIHRYHSLNRQWWDIWYHYIIWYDWVIYEWREWWDYVIWAHSSYNNNGTVWISILWNYELHWINDNQYIALESLIQNLTQKYGIDLSKERYYHMNCSWIKCDTFPLETYLDSVLVWHRDATHTTCPWEKLYEQIQQIRSDNLDFTAWFQSIPRGWLSSEIIQTDTQTAQIQTLKTALKQYSISEQQAIFQLINKKLEQDPDQELKEKLQILRLAIILNLDT